jgi:2-oxoglutarate ferredoxin oxidoreductase subunit delta
MRGEIRIDRELCKGCGYCVIACPKKLIAIDNNFNNNGYYPAKVVSMDECTGCALCATFCPEVAIEVFQLTEAES